MTFITFPKYLVIKNIKAVSSIRDNCIPRDENCMHQFPGEAIMELKKKEDQ